MAPTIATTLGALVTAEPALDPIGALKLPARSAYHLKKLRALVAAETTHFHEERTAYIKELGTAREGGFEIKPDSEAWTEFLKRMTELAAIPVELHWGAITLEMLGDQRVSEAELTALGPLFAEPDPETTP